MALIPCKECGEMISDEAINCPHCGCPTGKKKFKLTKLQIIIASVAAFVLLLLITNPSAESHKAKIEEVFNEGMSKTALGNNFLTNLIGKAFINAGMEVKSYGLFSVGLASVEEHKTILSFGILGFVIPTVSPNDIADELNKQTDGLRGKRSQIFNGGMQNLDEDDDETEEEGIPELEDLTEKIEPID